MKVKGLRVPFKVLDGDDFKPAGDTYPTLRAEAARVTAEKFPDREVDLNRIMVSDPDENGIVSAFVPYK
jgi:hypothetical protein